MFSLQHPDARASLSRQPPIVDILFLLTLGGDHGPRDPRILHGVVLELEVIKAAPVPEALLVRNIQRSS